LLAIFISVWQVYIVEKYISEIEWVLLEIIPPPEITRSPFIAESFFHGLHSSYIPVAGKAHFSKEKFQLGIRLK